MNITRRRGAIAFFITLGALLVGGLVTLNIGWIIRNERTFALAILGTILFSLVIAGVVLNTVFLVREVRRNERQNSFLNAANSCSIRYAVLPFSRCTNRLIVTAMGGIISVKSKPGEGATFTVRLPRMTPAS